MSWTVPTARATGDLITAAIYNADIINNIAYIGRSLRGAVASGGGTTSGAGFSSSRTAAGTYSITFPSFPVTPVVITDTNVTNNIAAAPSAISTTGFTCNTKDAGAGTALDGAFSFRVDEPST